MSGYTYIGPSSFIPLKEKIISDYGVIWLPIRHFITDVLNDKIVQLHESGIMGKLMEIPKPKENITDNDPAALSLDHLGIWFKLWLGLVLIAISFFLVEVFLGKVQQVVR
jgi:hypothetical protein